MRGAGAVVPPLAVVTDPLVANVTQRVIACTCRSDTGRAPVEFRATCADADAKECSYRITVQTQGRGDAAIEMKADGKVVDRFAIAVRDAVGVAPVALVPGHRGMERLRQEPRDFIGGYGHLDASRLSWCSPNQSELLELDEHPMAEGGVTPKKACMSASAGGRRLTKAYV